MRAIIRRIAATLAAALIAAPGVAGATDLHKLFEEHCAGCHGDAGPFAQEALAGVPLTAERLGAFILRHGRGFPADHAVAMADMLIAQAATPPFFKQNCAICHGRAAPLVRDRLILRDGVLMDRYTGRTMADFLRHHGALSPERQSFYLDLLRRIEAEVHHP